MEIHFKELLSLLDRDRWSHGKREKVAREFSPNGTQCRIVQMQSCTDDELTKLIFEEKTRAEVHKYSLEWKAYSHDGVASLSKKLLAAGFVAEDEESVLVLSLADLTTKPPLAITLPPGVEIVMDGIECVVEGVAEISRDLGRRDVESEKLQLTGILQATPELMNVYILKLNGEPVSCGRLHFPEKSTFAELAGGRTKVTHRKKGFFSALVMHRLHDAASRGRTHVLVDALPTSEPILKRLGFQLLTRTRPYVYEPEFSDTLAENK